MSSRSAKRRKIESPIEDGIPDYTIGSSEIESSEGSDGSMASGDDRDVSSEKDIEMESGSETDQEPVESQQRVTRLAPNPSPSTAKTNDNQPTRQSQKSDLKEAAYTSGSYKSNVFKLQVDELLEQIRPRPLNRKSTASQHLEELIATIEGIPARPLTSLAEAVKALKKQGVAVPFPDPQPEASSNLKFQYSQPKRVEVIGRYAAELNVRTQDVLIIDIGVEAPSSMFDAKDYLDYRYFYKRSCILACIAASIKKIPAFDCCFDFLDGNRLLPYLSVTAKQGLQTSSTRSKVSFRILPAYSKGTFAREKLLPSANCARDEKTFTKADDDIFRMTTSSFYNASIQGDGLYWSYLDLQRQIANQCEAYRDTCLLGHIWLRQRGLDSFVQQGGFGSFEWSILVALLLQGGGPGGKSLFSPGYSSFQLFKAVLQFFATKDLVKTPLTIGGSSSVSSERGDDTTPYLFDAAHGLNLFYKMTGWSYREMQLAARATLAALANTDFDNFGSTFVSRADASLLKSDLVVRIPMHALLGTAKPTSNYRYTHQKCHDVHRTLSQGLADRARHVHVRLPLNSTWDIDRHPWSMDVGEFVSFSMQFDPANAQRKIDHGPSAEEKQEAVEFRKFWGDKAELRRFNDGRILETLVWSDKAGESIFRQIVDHILSRHFGQKLAKETVYIGDGETAVLKGKRAKGSSNYAAFGPLRDAFRKFGEDLRGLEDLPLTIRDIMPADSQLGATSLHIPMIGNNPMTTPAGVVLQFEGSGRWPDDLAAIQKTKIAFLIKIGELLEAQIGGLEARMGLENQHIPLINEAHLDIFYPSGAAFRLRIMHDREQTLLERRLKLPSSTSSEKAEAAHALAGYKRDFIRRPAHVQAMQTLCSRFEALSATIRLLKAWFSSQLLSPYFSPTVIELFAARVFVNPAPWSTPASGTTSFLRSLVQLSKWDWRNEPWIVMLGETRDPLLNASSADDASARADVSTIRTRFEAWRKIDPQLHRLALFVASDIDSDGSTWTDHAQPPRVVAARMTGLARAASQAIIDSDKDLDLEYLFVPNLQDYDFVVHLKKGLVGDKKSSSKNGKFKNLQVQDDLSAAREYAGSVAPAQLFINDLQASFGDALLFFFDNEAADCVAAIWDPSLDGRPWKVRIPFSATPTVSKASETQNGVSSNDSEPQFIANINKTAILNEIARLGGDMVRKIDVK